MLQLLYILAFTVLALIAVGNLIRNLLLFSVDRERSYTANSSMPKGKLPYISSSPQLVPHPELLDNSGKLIKDPLLVMRSISVEDAREQLDALYDASPGYQGEEES